MRDCAQLPRTDYSRRAGEEPLPGYRLIEPLGRGGFGEVWRCAVPGGLVKAIKFVRGDLDWGAGGDGPAEVELGALERIKAIRHPFLLSMERIEVDRGTLMIVMELADRNLHDLRQEYLKAGVAGIPRDELLRLLAEAAEALDVLNIQHGLQHLDVKPSNLFLMYNHVKVGDFGLVDSQEPCPRRDKARDPGGLTALYVAPERLRNVISRHSDQYSLAVVYQELLTGVPPFQAKTASQLMIQHFNGQPNLAPLPPYDRAAVGRALAKDPEKRFPSCQAFIRALVEATPGTPTTPFVTAGADDSLSQPDRVTPTYVATVRDRLTAVMTPAVVEPAGDPDAWETDPVVQLPAVVPIESDVRARVTDGRVMPRAEQFIHGALLLGAGLERLAEHENLRYAHRTGQGLEYAFSVLPSSEDVARYFQEFCLQWDAEPVVQGDTLFLCRLYDRRGLWKQWMGWQTGVEVRLELHPMPASPREPGGGREALVKIRPFGEGGGGQRRFEETGPLLLQSLLSFLPTSSERRAQTRWSFLPPLQVYPVAGGTIGKGVNGLCRNLSLSGIGFWLPQPPPSKQVYLRLPTLVPLAPFAILARVVRSRKLAADRYEIGAALPRDAAL